MKTKISETMTFFYGLPDGVQKWKDTFDNFKNPGSFRNAVFIDATYCEDGRGDLQAFKGVDIALRLLHANPEIVVILFTFAPAKLVAKLGRTVPSLIQVPQYNMQRTKHRSLCMGSNLIF